MESAHLVLQRSITMIKNDGNDLNKMSHYEIVDLLLDRLEAKGFLVINAPVKRNELPGSLPVHIGKNHIGVLACMMRGMYQYSDIGNIRVRWGIPIDEAGDIELLVRLGYAERHPTLSASARITDQGRRVVEQARAHGYKREPNWCAMAG